MCTRFVYNGKETIVGFNFDIDLSEWEHTVMGMLAHCCMYMEMTMHNFAVMNHAIQ